MKIVIKLGSHRHRRILLLLLCCLPFFSPDGLGFTGASMVMVWFKRLQSVATFGMLLYELYYYVKHLSSFKQYQYLKRLTMFGLVVLMSLLQLFSTKVNGGDYTTALQRIYIMLGAYMVTEIFIIMDAKASLEALTYIFTAAAVINLVVVILFYDRMGFREQGDYWLFGQKNAMRNIVVPSITFSAILDRIRRKKYSFRTIYLMLTGILVLILVDSSASVAIIALFAALLLYLNVSDFELLNLKTISVIYVVLEIVVVFMRRINIFSNIIEGALNRDVTLTNRTLIWDKAMKAIKASPIIGDGLRELKDSKLVVGNFQASHAHNAFLDILMKCGIVGAVLLVVIVYLCIRQQFKMKKSALGAILGMTVGLFLIAGIVGELWSFGFYLVLFTTYYLPEMAKQVEIGNIYTKKRTVRLKLTRE